MSNPDDFPLTCGRFDSSFQHLYPADAKPGDRCLCGATQYHPPTPDHAMLGDKTPDFLMADFLNDVRAAYDKLRAREAQLSAHRHLTP